MIYAFRCDGCSSDVDVERPMAQASDPAPCPMCTAPMRRIYHSHSICDEIRGTEYYHPRLCRKVKDHGKYFDVGGGFWVHSKSQRKMAMAKRGLGEVGPNMV